MSLVWLFVGVFVVSTLGTGLLRRYALARSVLDIPNERSSHRVPTPRGGGLAIVVGFLLGTLGLAASGHISGSIASALAGGGVIVALVGFIDDHRPVPPLWRLIAHFVAASWVLFWLGGLPPILVLGRLVDLGLAGDVVASVALVWLLNLYNFMDGVDGIAGTEVVTVGLGAAMLYVSNLPGSAEWALPVVLAASALGFLVWNFPPAKIFMGDAGSGFLGLMLGALAVLAAGVSPNFLWSWIILLGVFVVDATVTLLSRVRRGKKIHVAHRSHAYQHAASRSSHRAVSLAVAAINVLWLLPLALLVGARLLDGIVGILIAYVPLVWYAAHLNAGTDQNG